MLPTISTTANSNSLHDGIMAFSDKILLLLIAKRHTTREIVNHRIIPAKPLFRPDGNPVGLHRGFGLQFSLHWCLCTIYSLR